MADIPWVHNFGDFFMPALQDEELIRPSPAGSGAAAARPGPTRLEQGPCEDGKEGNKEKIVYLEPLEGPHWRIKVRNFGDGCIEALGVLMDGKPENRKRKPKGEGLREQMDVKELEKCNRRARRAMRHKVMMMKADRLLTLTTRECIEDREEFMRALKRFLRLCREQFGSFVYVCVLELQERGAYHAHLALNRFYNVNVLRHLWKKAVGGDANVDMTSPRRGFWNRHKIAGYLAKYMSKDLEGQRMNTKRYMSSEGIEKPVELEFFMPVAWDVFYLLKQVVEVITGVPMRRWFESKDGGIPIIWFASYG